MRLALAPLLLLAACQRGPAPAGNHAEASPPPAANAVQPQGDVATAERLVRQRLGANGETHFVEAHGGAHDGVPIVCGAYEQGGARQRYIVVAGDQAFIESQMRAGEMNRAVREFCGDGERG